MAQYLQIVDGFNEWGKTYGYQAEIAAPVFNENLDTHYWLGRSADNETFGKAYDAWMAAQNDASSVPARINERFSECMDNATRRAYWTSQ